MSTRRFLLGVMVVTYVSIVLQSRVCQNRPDAGLIEEGQQEELIHGILRLNIIGPLDQMWANVCDSCFWFAILHR